MVRDGSPNRRAPRGLTLAVAGIVIALLALCAAGMAVPLATRSALNESERADRLEESYDDARLALARMGDQLDRAERRMTPLIQRRLHVEGSVFARAMRTVAENGTASERALARRLLRDYRASFAAGLRLMVAGLRGDRPEQARLRRFIRESYARTFAAIDEAEATQRRVAAERRADLRAHQQRGLIAVPIASFLGVSLLVALFAMLRRRDRALQRAAVAQLERAAFRDSLTELRNHRAFCDDLARELNRARRAGAPLALVLLDLDELKRVNDSDGHPAGDRRLRAVADGLRATLRGGDIAYRIGGDEFAVIMPATGAWGAFVSVSRLRDELATADPDDPVTVTAGIEQAREGDGREELVHRADAALIEAKRRRRGALLWSPGLEGGGATASAPLGDDPGRTLAASLARAVDSHDPEVRRHCEGVAELSAAIARELGLDEDRVEQVRLAGLLHDVGKVGVSEETLRKPGPLDEREWEKIRAHPVVGHRILSGAGLHDEARWILHHHEHPDGTGYPGGLAGDEIPLESRILLVADAFEAMTSDRPHRPRRSEAEALAELERCARRQFDPDCVAALRRTVPDGRADGVLAGGEPARA